LLSGLLKWFAKMVHLAGELECYVLEGDGYGEMLLWKNLMLMLMLLSHLKTMVKFAGSDFHLECRTNVDLNCWSQM
jgi:hypothetical protein